MHPSLCVCLCEGPINTVKIQFHHDLWTTEANISQIYQSSLRIVYINILHVFCNANNV